MGSSNRGGASSSPKSGVPANAEVCQFTRREVEPVEEAAGTGFIHRIKVTFDYGERWYREHMFCDVFKYFDPLQSCGLGVLRNTSTYIYATITYHEQRNISVVRDTYSRAAQDRYLRRLGVGPLEGDVIYFGMPDTTQFGSSRRQRVRPTVLPVHHVTFVPNATYMSYDDFKDFCRSSEDDAPVAETPFLFTDAGAGTDGSAQGIGQTPVVHRWHKSGRMEAEENEIMVVD